MQRNRHFWPPRGRVKPAGHETESASFFERVWDRFLVRDSCSSSSSSPRPSLILFVLPFIRALFVRMFVPPGPHGGYLGCILDRLGSLLGRLRDFLGRLGDFLGAAWAVLERSRRLLEPSWPIGRLEKQER